MLIEKTIAGWQAELVRVHQGLGDLFARSEVRERSLGYLEGLLSDCERKNGWQVRRWLEERRQAYVLAVASDQRLWREDFRQHRVDEIASQLPKRAWKRLSAGYGSKGERLYDWALLPWAEDEGWEHALLVRRSIEQKPEYAFYFTYAHKRQSTLKTLVSVAGRR